MSHSLTPAVPNILTSSIHGPSHMVLSIRFLSSDWLKIICSRASRLGAATTTTQRRCRRPTRILELRGRMRGGEGMGPGWSNFSTFCSSNMSWVFMPEISVNFHNDDYVTRYFVAYLSLYSCNWKTKHFTAGVDLDPPYFLSWIWRNKFSKNRTLVLHTLHTYFTEYAGERWPAPVRVSLVSDLLFFSIVEQGPVLRFIDTYFRGIFNIKKKEK